LSQFVGTGSEKPGKAKKIQPGDREWANLLQGVGMTGCASRPSSSLQANFIFSWTEMLVRHFQRHVMGNVVETWTWVSGLYFANYAESI
jgi:hypothetical protein